MTRLEVLQRAYAEVDETPGLVTRFRLDTPDHARVRAHLQPLEDGGWKVDVIPDRRRTRVILDGRERQTIA